MSKLAADCAFDDIKNKMEKEIGMSLSEYSRKHNGDSYCPAKYHVYTKENRKLNNEIGAKDYAKNKLNR